jgi:hypothetical protein
MSDGYRFAIHNSDNKYLVNTQPVNQPPPKHVNIPASANIPKEGNILFTIDGALYFKSDNGTITLIASS